MTARTKSNRKPKNVRTRSTSSECSSPAAVADQTNVGLSKTAV